MLAGTGGLHHGVAQGLAVRCQPRQRDHLAGDDRPQPLDRRLSALPSAARHSPIEMAEVLPDPGASPPSPWSRQAAPGKAWRPARSGQRARSRAAEAAIRCRARIPSPGWGEGPEYRASDSLPMSRSGTVPASISEISDTPAPHPRPLSRWRGSKAAALGTGHRDGVQENVKIVLTSTAPQRNIRGPHRHKRCGFARVAELVDALASGASGGNSVEVRVLSRAPSFKNPRPVGGFFLAQCCAPANPAGISRNVCNHRCPLSRSAGGPHCRVPAQCDCR